LDLSSLYVYKIIGLIHSEVDFPYKPRKKYAVDKLNVALTYNCIDPQELELDNIMFEK
jgi:hypothetical protein